MHAVGLHSALAIKRQRKRRDEQRRAKERRYSSQSGESGLTSPRLSTASLDQHHGYKRRFHNRKPTSQGIVDSKSVTSVGMLHIGVVFLVLGIFLLISGILPNDITTWGSNVSGTWFNELVALGLFSITVGCFLIILNRIIAKKEENDLEEYVKRQLTRSKSGHRLERDLETGELTTKHGKQAKKMKNKFFEDVSERGNVDSTLKIVEIPITTHNNCLFESSFDLKRISEEDTIIIDEKRTDKDNFDSQVQGQSALKNDSDNDNINYMKLQYLANTRVSEI